MALSPMMQHYMEVKEQYKDCIVFYRLGDFYEMFFDDAIKASSMLDLTLTGRDCGLKDRAPMCGIPYHAVDGYIAKLVSLGEKVAICEQLSEPNSSGLVDRDVIRVVTAGTVTDNASIDDKKNNFLGCVYMDENNASFSWADITTGEFFTKQFSLKDGLSSLFDLLTRVSPAEIIANKFATEKLKDSPFFVRGVLPNVQPFLESEFNGSNAYATLLNQFKVNSLRAYNLKEDDCSVYSSGALLSYLSQTQKHALLNITEIKKETDDNRMMLDLNAVRNLELIKTLRDGKTYGSLLWVLDKTKTSMGARKLSSYILSPLCNKTEIEYRLDAVDTFFQNNLVRAEISDVLSSVKDVGRLAGKIANGNLMPKDCLLLRDSLSVIPRLKFSLSGVKSKLIDEIIEKLSDFSSIVDLLTKSISDDCSQTIKDGNCIKKGYSKELDELKEYSKNGHNKISRMEAIEREKTGIKNLKISYNRVFGYYIEVTNSFKELVPYDYIRRQTLANAERYITNELKDLESKILSSEEDGLRLEIKLYNEIINKLSIEITRLNLLADGLADLDVFVSLATVAKENGYVKPIIQNKSSALDVVESRHPVVEAISKQKFVPNDCFLDSGDSRTMILTGPNMAGKSTYMRQIALITLMAHIGSFVPAKSALIPLTDKIFTRVGASDNLIYDQSTFMVEMNEVAEIINGATESSLIVLDEIGRGTSTYDGLSIAWAIVEYITKNIKAKTLFATHYHELTELEGSLDGVKNYKVTVKETQAGIVFLRKIMRGGANRSFGIEVAELAGVKNYVTDRAKEILKRLEATSSNKNEFNVSTEIASVKQKTEVERILEDLDLNNITPLQAFDILSDLKEKVKNNE